MPFGWKTEYEKKVPANGLSNWEIFAIAKEACRNLDWEYLVVDEHTFTATTPTNWTLTEEIITIQPEKEKILFKSKSENIELLEARHNQKNIEEELLPAFNKVRKDWSATQLQNAATAIQTETLKQLTTGNRVDSGKITFGFKDHEVTFLLIALKLIVFTTMAINGVSAINPVAGDILKWGGCLKAYVTGGEWWRLISAIFAHKGVVDLLVSMAALYFIGLMVESILGKAKFLIAFLCAGMLGNLAGIMWYNETVIAGASGAVFGLYGVFLAFATTAYINKQFPKGWLLSILSYVIFSVVIGIRADVYNAINFGGFVSGICIGYLFYFFHFKRNVARAGGTRISVEVLIITSLLVFLYIRSKRNDTMRFEKAIMKLNQIEVKAMTQMQHLQFTKSNKEAAEVLRDSTLPEWQHFQKELIKTDSYKLNDKFTQKRKLLSKYAQMRVLQTTLLYESIKDSSDRHHNRINSVSDSIDLIIDQLGY
ncbi:MAG: rhomboid family intramembrane serine protease [Segetibacter sp.]|nr:rhomboid family intramembrane serine protease [Segetibacter sp.]